MQPLRMRSAVAHPPLHAARVLLLAILPRLQAPLSVREAAHGQLLGFMSSLHLLGEGIAQDLLEDRWCAGAAQAKHQGAEEVVRADLKATYLSLPPILLRHQQAHPRPPHCLRSCACCALVLLPP